MGHEIIIWTCRDTQRELRMMESYLDSLDIPYDYINENSRSVSFQPTPKIYYDILIDDRNFGTIIDWYEIEKTFDNLYGNSFIKTKLKDL